MANLALFGGSHSGGESNLSKWYRKISGHPTLHAAKHHAKEGGHAIAQVGESLVVGGALGAAKAHFGTLDATVAGHSVPVDAAGAVVALFGSVAMANDPVAAFGLRNAAASAATVFSYRKMEEYMNAKKGAPAPKPSTAHGEFGAEDPIIAAARRL